MFPFDVTALPQLTTRKALIIVDFQHDFLAPDGALPVTQPAGFVGRTTELAAALRGSADIIWVKTKPKQYRDPEAEHIVVSDEPVAHPDPVSTWRALRRAMKAEDSSERSADAAEAVDEEAFLSQDESACLTSAAGVELAVAVDKTDVTITKSHYSAFKNTQLLFILRARMAMQVFICGSLTNVGLYATAMDAAGHGLSITVVDDCCGYRSEARKDLVLRNLDEFTGCEVTSAQDVMQMLGVSSPAPPFQPNLTAAKAPNSTQVVRDRTGTPPDLVQTMSELQLSSKPRSDVASTEPNESTTKPFHETQSPISTANTPSAAETGKADLQAAAAPNPPESARHVGPPTTSVLIKDHDCGGGSNGPENEKHIQLNEKPEKGTTTESEIAMKGRHPAKDEQTPNPPQNGLGAGDTDVIENMLSKELEESIFAKLTEEVAWQRMSHQGGEVPRLVAVQGQVADDGSIPIYRHPSDEAPPLLPFSKSVLAIKEETEKRVGHPLNHVLIQFYRDGNDYISEHSDKTLDIVKESFIANVSLGAERTMVLRTKRVDKDPSQTEPPAEDGKKRKVQRARLAHNSLFRMGLKTNMSWLHSIRQDKRAERDKTAEELAYAGQRISLTFRYIGTFLSRDETLIWGQGATGKACEDAKPVINGQSTEAVKMLRAFGTENHSSKFSWDATYGKGFDVLHMSNSPRFFASSDPVVNMRIALILAEFGISYAKGSMGAPKGSFQNETGGLLAKYVDNDESKSVVEGDVAIMLYLDALYGRRTKQDPIDRVLLAKQYTLFQRGLHLLTHVRRGGASGDETAGFGSKSLRQELEFWNGHAAGLQGGFLTGSDPFLPDFAVWPVLHHLVVQRGIEVFDGFEPLKRYYKSFRTRECAAKVTGNSEEKESQA